MEAILGEKLPAGKFEDILRDGVFLCKFMLKLMPGSVPKINTSGGQFKFMENINYFLSACNMFGVPKQDTFQSIDLYEKKNIAAVTQCIVAIGRVCCLREDFKGPYLVSKATSDSYATDQTSVLEPIRASGASPSKYSDDVWVKQTYRIFEDSIKFYVEREITEIISEYIDLNKTCDLSTEEIEQLDEDAASAEENADNERMAETSSPIIIHEPSSPSARMFELQNSNTVQANLEIGQMSCGVSNSTVEFKSESNLDGEKLLAKYPKFVVPLIDNICVRLHARVELKSRIEPKHDKTLVIEWFKDDVPIVCSQRVSTYFNLGYVALIIGGYEQRDDGRYTCVATNEFGTDRVQAILQLDSRYFADENEQQMKEEKIKRLLKIKESMKLAERLEKERKAEYEARQKLQYELEIEERRRADRARRDARVAAKRAELESEAAREMSHQSAAHHYDSKAENLSKTESATPRECTYIVVPYRILEDSIFYRRELTIYETITEYEPDDTQASDAAIKASDQMMAGMEETSSRLQMAVGNNQGAKRLRGGDSIPGASSSKPFEHEISNQSGADEPESVNGSYMTEDVSELSISHPISKIPDEVQGTGVNRAIFGIEYSVRGDKILGSTTPSTMLDGPIPEYPKFVVPLIDNICVRLHARVELKSRIEPKHDKTLVIEWFKDDVPIVCSQRVSTYFNLGYVALIIGGYEQRDDGRYTCVATNEFGTDRVQAILQLDSRYFADENEQQMKEEKIKRLLKIKESMKLAERLEKERKAEYEARQKLQYELEIEERRRADRARRDARVAAKRAELESEAAREMSHQSIDEPRQSAQNQGRSNSTDVIGVSPEEGFISDDEILKYRYRPYRVLEDTIFLRRDREIYETVTEFEPEISDTQNEVAVLDTIKEGKHPQVGCPRSHDMSELAVRRLRGGDVQDGIGDHDRKLMSELRRLDLVIGEGKYRLSESNIIGDEEAGTSSVNGHEKLDGPTPHSEDSDGYQEDSFIYTNFKISESPSVDEDIIRASEEASGIIGGKTRRRAIFSNNDAELDSFKIEGE